MIYVDQFMKGKRLYHGHTGWIPVYMYELNVHWKYDVLRDFIKLYGLDIFQYVGRYDEKKPSKEKCV